MKFTAIIVLLIGLVAIVCSSCTTLLRENVLATTETKTGLSIAQNPQTNLYEFDFGYKRREFFFVPTSKHIKQARDKGSAQESNDPSATPEVLAVIGTSGGASGNEGRVAIAQALAVGAIAVTSPVAIAVFSRDPDVADAASKAMVARGIGGLKSSTVQSVIALATHAIRGLRSQAEAQDLDAVSVLVDLDRFARTFRAVTGTKRFEWNGSTLTKRDLSFPEIKKVEDLLNQLRELNDSHIALQAALKSLSAAPVGSTVAVTVNSSTTQMTSDDISKQSIAVNSEMESVAQELMRSREYSAAMNYFIYGVAPAKTQE